MSTFVELQREYGETLWNQVSDGVRARGEVLREAADKAGDALRTAYNAAEEERHATAQAAA